MLTTFRIINKDENLRCMAVGTSLGISYDHSTFSAHLLELDKVFLVEEKQQHSWFLLIFQLVEEASSYDQAVTRDPLRQGLSSAPNT